MAPDWARLRRRAAELLALPETALLLVSVVTVVAAMGFVELSEHIAGPRLGGLDRMLLRWVRQRVVSSPDGVVATAAWNFTALGGAPVLTLVTALAVGALLLDRALVQSAYAVVAIIGGALWTRWLKQLFSRERPSIVEHLLPVDGYSFPSGHAMASTVVYVTLAALVSTHFRRRRAKLYTLWVSLLLAGLVGSTRVVLGVHYPSDVLAGWLSGLAWALLCWLGWQLWLRRLNPR